MVRDMETFYPRKDEMGNGPIELVKGNVLDKVNRVTNAPAIALPWWQPGGKVVAMGARAEQWLRGLSRAVV